MIVISDCVRNNLDEGCIKVASSLSKRLQGIGARLIAVNCDCDYADNQIRANKLYSNREIYDLLADASGNILYIPFASNTLGTALRMLNLRCRSKKRITVLFALRWKMNLLTKFVLRLGMADIITISQDSYEYFRKELKGLNVTNVKLGVDSSLFTEADEEQKVKLRKKYGIPQDKTVVLHVGHLKYGRNIDLFLNVDEKYHVVLVFSSVTEQDKELKKRLESKSNVQIINEYIENIAEIYQASDIYVFPIVEENNSIDIPLSVLEAAGCNKRIISTSYKEIAFFESVPGLDRIDNDQIISINDHLSKIEKQVNVCTRSIAKKYDWNDAVKKIYEMIDGE